MADFPPLLDLQLAQQVSFPILKFFSEAFHQHLHQKHDPSYKRVYLDSIQLSATNDEDPIGANTKVLPEEIKSRNNNQIKTLEKHYTSKNKNHTKKYRKKTIICEDVSNRLKNYCKNKSKSLMNTHPHSFHKQILMLSSTEDYIIELL